MTTHDVELHLRMHIVNICLAATAGRENDLRECKNLLVEKVHGMIEHEARRAQTKG